MPRQARLDAPGTLHHVMGRGIEGNEIFRVKKDREDFLDRLATVCEERGLICYAWALMSNHFHLLVRSGNHPLADGMRKILTGYVVNFNRRHKRYGHLFQNRYKSIVFEDDPYLLELTRYIHLNPVRAGVVEDLSSLRRYPWSGHSALMGKVKRSWQDTGTVLGYFGRSKKEAISHYGAFVRDGVTQGPRPDLVGGGLIRSLGGWSQVLSLRRKGIKAPYDERVLGSGEFLQHLLEEVEERERETLRLSKKVKDLDSIAEEIAREEGLTEEKLRSGSRAKRISSARRLFCQLAVGKMGYSGAQVARFLGVTTSAVNRAANSEEHETLHRYL